MSIFLRRWPDALRPSENSIESHMVSYCSAIKVNNFQAVEVGGKLKELDIASRRGVSPDGTYLKRDIQSIMFSCFQ